MNMVTLSIGFDDGGRAGGLLHLVNAAATYDHIIVQILVFFSVYVRVTQLQVLDSTASLHNAALSILTIVVKYKNIKSHRIVQLFFYQSTFRFLFLTC